MPTAEEKYPLEDWHYEVANGDTILGLEEWRQHKIASEVEFVHDIVSLDDTGHVIGIAPYVSDTGEVGWELYIPPTVPEAFEQNEDGTFDPETSAVVKPYGVTKWSSLETAIVALSLARRAGNIKFNDGRTVR